MDVMEPLGTHDLFQGLSNNTLLDSGFQDEDNKDSLFELLSQTFPDMITQPFGHLSSLPLDVPDLLLNMQEDFEFQEEAADSADDSILQEFVSEVQNILSDSKRSNVTNAPELGASLPSITPLLSTTEDHFSPVKKLCPDQIDLLMGPLLDEDEDLPLQIKETPFAHSTPVKQCPGITSVSQKREVNYSDTIFIKARKPERINQVKPAVACVKPILKTDITGSSKPLVSLLNEMNTPKPSVANMSATRVMKAEEESSDEVDIETVDDDELNGRSGAEVLFAQLANENCQAARVRVMPPKIPPVSCLQVPPTEASHKTGFDQSTLTKTDVSLGTGLDQSIPSKSLPPAAPSFLPVVKTSPKPKEKEQSPSSVVEKIKQSAVAPRSSILIPHQGPPQSRGKSMKQEKVVKSCVSDSYSACPSPYDARTLDHDYCNKNLVEQPAVAAVAATTQDPWTVVQSDVCVYEENILVPDLEVPIMGAEVSLDTTQREPVLPSENKASCDLPLRTSKPPQKEAAVPVVKPERELPLSYRNWHNSRSPSPYSQTRCKKRGSRRRSSCSPSSVSSHSIYRSRSRSLSRGRKGRTQTYKHRKHSKGRKSHSHRSIKRSRYTYSRSSSRSSFSSRSCSRSLSRSRSRTSSRSRSRSRSRSWDSKRIYARAPVTKYTWPQEKRHFNDGKSQQIEERRVVYVGRLPDGTTKNDLRHRFGCFGPIQEVSVHFRDSGHNYGFVTFSYKRDAYEAVEHGNDDPNLPKFDLSFGGRRQFCQQRYSDLDSQYSYSAQRQAGANDFDSLLRAAKSKIKKKY